MTFYLSFIFILNELIWKPLGPLNSFWYLYLNTFKRKYLEKELDIKEAEFPNLTGSCSITSGIDKWITIY